LIGSDDCKDTTRSRDDDNGAGWTSANLAALDSTNQVFLSRHPTARPERLGWLQV
jgi:hypothetical protein